MNNTHKKTIHKDEFSRYHPVVNFTYFSFVLLFSMTISNPVIRLISLICSVIYSIELNGKKGILFNLKLSLPILIITIIINPAFNHSGVTIITYLPTGNPLTLESIIYGISSGFLLAGILVWFMCFNMVLTSDKFIYLFGKAIPSISLLLSMILRFIPKYKEHFKEVSDAQKCMGKNISKKNLIHKMKRIIKIFSITITWSLENAIETADSMKSKGYGLKGRSSFSIYNFRKKDALLLLWIIFCGIYVIIGCLSGTMYFKYIPIIRYAEISAFNISIVLIFLMFCITPVIINLKEKYHWKSIKSKI